MKRFEMEASTIEEAKMYILNRARQLMHTGLRFVRFTEMFSEKIVWAQFEDSGKTYFSGYVLAQYRGDGAFLQEYARMQEIHGHVVIVTSIDCNIAGYLNAKDIPYILVNGLVQHDVYKLMEKFYGDNGAKRSDVFFMNHLDEGLYILKQIGAGPDAMLAYLLHPMFQSDEDLGRNGMYVQQIESRVHVMLAMEYRSVANEYLSKREINSIDEIRLSPLTDVNDMLIADKVQNRKDFLMYHLGTHARSEALDQYFINWLKRLGVTEGEYDTLTIPIVALDGEYNRLKRKTEQ